MKVQFQLGRARRGFTLVELMVAAAVSVLIMAILSSAFQIALDAMRQVRSAADMADQLRAVGGVVQKDLGRNGGTFFAPDENNSSNYGVKLSDWLLPNTKTTGGYFFVSSSMSTLEGSDAAGYTSSVATSHSIAFTSVLPGLMEKDNYTAVLPATNATITSPAAEVAYFLAPSGQTLPNGNTLFNLIRRQWLVAKSNSDATRLSQAVAADPVNGPQLISTSGVGVNTLQSLSISSNRAWAATGLNPIGSGQDILLSNVISFEVRVNGGQSRLFGAPGALPGPDNIANNSDFPFDTLIAFPPVAGPPSYPGFIFDSTVPNANYPKIQVRGVQIRIRIYDPKTQNARQITIVQDL
jgi:prepilin-type N-terminal cleavage/methylation domain-containing protein